MHKAIETRHAGYLFRSRLEARFSVFFTRAGVDCRYEPEGYELPGGMRYLPDYYLPGLDCWIEVKPNTRRVEAGGLKLEAFAGGIDPGQRFYVLVDEPSPTGEVYRPAATGKLKKSSQRWTECGGCGRVDLLPTCDPPGVTECRECGESRLLDQRSPRLLAAYGAARCARFE